MPGRRIEDVLKAAELEDSDENRSLLRQIAQEEGVDLAPEFETSSRALLDQPESPTVQVPSTSPARMLGDKSFGVTGDFDVVRPPKPQENLLGRVATYGPQRERPKEATGQALLRAGVGATEGVVNPIIQAVSEIDSKTRRAFPHGDLGLDEFMENAGLLTQATVEEHFAQRGAEIAGFFAPVSAGARAVETANIVPRAAKFLIEPTMVAIASTLASRAETERAGTNPLNLEDAKSFWGAMALTGAGALVGVPIAAGITKLMGNKAVMEPIKKMTQNASMGALFGVYTGHNEELERSEFWQEVGANAAGFLLGGQVGHLFSGEARPNTARQAKASVEAVASGIAEYAERPNAKFEAMAAGTPEAAATEKAPRPGYVIRKQMAENFWTNRQAQGGEVPTFEQVRDAFQLTDKDARGIVSKKITPAEKAEVAKNLAAPTEAAPAPEAVRSEGLGEPGVLASAPVGPKAISAPPPPDVTQVSKEVGRQVVAPGEIPPPERAPAAPVEISGMEAAQRLRTIRSRLQEKGLPPAERASLQQERTKIIGSDLPFDPDFARQRTVRQALAPKPPRTQTPSPTEVEAVRRASNPKAPPKEREAARAVLRGSAQARKAATSIEAAKPTGTALHSFGPEVLKEWHEASKKILPKIKPPEYEALNNGKPGPKAIERYVGEIEDIFHDRPHTREAMREARKELTEVSERARRELNIPAGKVSTAHLTVAEGPGRFVLPTIDYHRQFGPAGNTIADGEMRVWSRVLARENEILLDLSEKQMQWGEHGKLGRVYNWAKELTDSQSKKFHEWQDAYLIDGKRGKDLPRLTDDDVRLHAAAWAKARLKEQPLDLTPAEEKIVDGYVEWSEGTYKWFLNNAIEAGKPTKALQATVEAEGQYLPVQLRDEVFEPRQMEGWVEKGTPMVRTDKGIMTKDELVKQVAQAKRLQDAIVKAMVGKPDPSTGNGKLTEEIIRTRLEGYRDTYYDKYAQKIVDRQQQGVNQPETNLTLHRFFNTAVGAEGDMSKLLAGYMRPNLLAIEMAREWGPQLEMARSLIEMAGTQGYERKPLADAFDIAMLQDPEANRQSGAVMSELRGWTMFAKLGGTVFLQVPQDVTIAAHTGFRNYAKGIPKTLRARIYSDPNLPIAIREKLGDRLSAKYIAMTGALVESELHTAIEQLHGWGPKAAAFMLSKTGMRMIDQFNRGHAGISGYIYGEGILNDYRYATSAKAKAQAEAKIREAFQDPKDVEAALRGDWVKNDVERERLASRVGDSVAYRSQFRTLPIDMPLARTDGRFRAMYDLRGYSIRATREAFRVFNMRNPNSPLRNRSTALRWLNGMAAAGLSAWFIKRLKDAVLGKDPESDPWWVATRDALVQVGFFPIFKDLWDQARGAFGDKNPAEIVIGPAGEFAGEQVKMTAKAIEDTSFKPFYRGGADLIPTTPFERLGPGYVREKLKAAGAEPTSRRSRVRVRVRRRVHTSQ